MHDDDDVDELAALDRVMHEVGVDAEPEVHQGLAEFTRHALCRDRGAPGGAMRKAGRRQTEVRGDARPDAVGADQYHAALIADLAAAPRQRSHAFAVDGELLNAPGETE